MLFIKHDRIGYRRHTYAVDWRGWCSGRLDVIPAP